jgi:hypothetical protein
MDSLGSDSEILKNCPRKGTNILTGWGFWGALRSDSSVRCQSDRTVPTFVTTARRCALLSIATAFAETIVWSGIRGNKSQFVALRVNY